MEIYPYSFELHAKQREMQVRKQTSDTWKYTSFEFRRKRKTNVSVFSWIRKVKHA